MGQRYWAVIRNGYVIERIIWDGISNWQYPHPHDFLIEDKDENLGIGDWYEESENIFYRPIGIPVDVPLEIMSLLRPGNRIE